MLAMTSCLSNAVKVKTEYKTIYVVPELSKPKFPESRNKVIPLDKDFHKVTNVNTDIEWVFIPFWYYKLIVEYKVSVDEQFAKYDAFKAELEKSE